MNTDFLSVLISKIRVRKNLLVQRLSFPERRKKRIIQMHTDFLSVLIHTIGIIRVRKNLLVQMLSSSEHRKKRTKRMHTDVDP